MTFEQRMAELGVDLSDLPDEYSMGQCASACMAASKWAKYSDYTVPYNYILHLVDVIDRMETRIVNLTLERDYLVRLYGFDFEGRWKIGAQTMTDLKPCPFCGGKAKHLMRTYALPSETYLVYCEDCKAEGQPCSTEAEAGEAWNRRAAPWKE